MVDLCGSESISTAVLFFLVFALGRGEGSRIESLLRSITSLLVFADLLAVLNESLLNGISLPVFADLLAVLNGIFE